MLYTRLDATGEHFEPQRNLMTSTKNLDGGGSVAADADGNVYVVWHAHTRGGLEDEAYRRVFVARSTDRGKTFAPEWPVNPEETGACGCCGLKAFADKQGRLAVLYRSADAAGNRDATLLVSKDHGRSFQARILGQWRVSTCPMSTQALGLGLGNDLLAMWETQGQIYRRRAASDWLEAGVASFTSSGDTHNRKHPVYAANEGKGLPPRLLMAWVEGTGWGRGGSLAWECVDLDANTKSCGRAAGVQAWSFVAAVPDPDGGFTVIW